MTQQCIKLTQEQFQELLGARNGGNDGPSKAATPMRPTIDIDTSEGEWAVFEDQWERYKRMAKVTAIADVRDNLRQCCASQLNKRLFDVKGAAALNGATEQDLLLWIRETAVKGVHKEVHRTQYVACKVVCRILVKNHALYGRNSFGGKKAIQVSGLADTGA